MIRTNLFIMFSSLVFLIGCSRGNEDPKSPAATAQESVRAESWRENRMLVGQEVYEAACASCHDQGDQGAPAIGNRESWSGRSDLWTAVLAGHATAGYLDMPEKGGHSELTDENVSAAVEYMLLKTFPEMPRE
jgi:cytochrome c5